MRSMYFRLSGGVVLALTFLLSCSRPSGEDSVSAVGDSALHGRPNIVLISLDTLRPDRLGAYGYERNTSPAIDALARRGRVFDQAIAETPWTLPSHVSMLSGLSPAQHGVVKPSFRVPPSLAWTPEQLQRAGYKTIGLTDGGYVDRTHRFERGFDVFDETPAGIAPAVAEAKREIEAAGADPWFLFLHSYDVHCPYTPRAPYASMFQSTQSEPIETEGKCGKRFFNQTEMTPGQVQYVSDRYDGGVRQADDDLAEFLAELSQNPSTLVILTSDHGEELGEHGRIGHDKTLYNEALRIPLIVAGPGVERGRSSSPASLVDVSATILAAAGLPFPARNRGRDLRSEAWEGAGEELVSSLHWGRPMRSLFLDDHHLIEDRKSGRTELYDVDRDPMETKDLAASSPEEVARLRAILRAHEAREPRIPPDRIPSISPEDRKRLEALGYVL